MLHSPISIPHNEAGTRIMGIDYGEKRVGIALSDTSWTIGSAYTTLASQGKEKDISQIEEISKEKSVSGFVVGIPRARTEKGSTALLCSKILEFRSALLQATQKPVSLYEETFSSKISEKILVEMRMGTRGKKLYVDRMAAAYILQSFLEWNKIHN